MENEYSVSIKRNGPEDLPELCRCQTAAIAAEVVRVMLEARDPLIVSVSVAVVRIK